MKITKSLRSIAHQIIPEEIYRKLRNIAMSRFLRDVDCISISEKLALIDYLYTIHKNVSCPHKQEEVLQFMRAIFKVPEDMAGVVIEAGCYKGGSTAKFSLACKNKNRKLVVFDSFQGIPENSERHGNNIYGVKTKFSAGDYCGTLSEVKQNVAAYGDIAGCEFIEGWFEDTLPKFHEPVCAAYIDVDLKSSTKTCLKYIFPLLQPGGIIVSQDGHLPLVIEAFDDDNFWAEDIGVPKPKIYGLRNSKILRIIKE